MWTDALIAELNRLAEQRVAAEKIEQALRSAIVQLGALEAKIEALRKENLGLRSAQETKARQ